MLLSQVYLLHLDLGPAPKDSIGEAMFRNDDTRSVKYGVVIDNQNGTYIATVCPVVSVSN